MSKIADLIQQVEGVKNGFGEIRKVAQEQIAALSSDEALKLAKELFASESHQARMLATFLWGYLAGETDEAFVNLYTLVSHDSDWRVQEILAQAFDAYCAALGYETALPTIKSWLQEDNPNLRRAVTEGLRIWTARPYFREHPQEAIQLLSQCKGDSSEYVRKSTGNALRDISRKHPELIQAEVATWNLDDKQVKQTYKLASKFILEK
jgi:3-methyladenine DNA glycosylase AlkD